MCGSFVPSGILPFDGRRVAGRRKHPAAKVGRPRKWASDAERERAYRQRLTAEVEEVRAARQLAVQCARENARLRLRLDTAKAMALSVAAAVDDLKARLAWLTDGLAEERMTNATLRDQCAALQRDPARISWSTAPQVRSPPVADVPRAATVVTAYAAVPRCAVEVCGNSATMRVRVGRGVDATSATNSPLRRAASDEASCCAATDGAAGAPRRPSDPVGRQVASARRTGGDGRVRAPAAADERRDAVLGRLPGRRSV